MAVAEVTVKLAALTPLNVTAVALAKVVPLSVTLLPTGPLGGAKLVIVGGLPPGAPVKKAFKRFAVVCWIRESAWPMKKVSSLQLQANVPAEKTHALLGAW